MKDVKRNSYGILAEANLQKILILEKQISKLKNVRINQGRKGGAKKLAFAYDSVETENKNKEVLDC